MKLRLMMAGVFAAALPAIADTNLFDNGTWSLVGLEVTNQDLHKIAVEVDKEPAGEYALLVLQFNFEGIGPSATCIISGEGPIRMLLPPPGVPGGKFELCSFWDCQTGYVPPVAFTELSFVTKGNPKQPLKATGKLSNFDSLDAKKVNLWFSPAETNHAQLELKYQLRTTRDICIDTTRHINQDEFRTVSMEANYLSAQSNQNDLVRYTRVQDENCDPWSGCHTTRETFCANIAGESGYLFGEPRRLADPTLAFFHTVREPFETPTLAVDFRAPGPRAHKPQAFITSAFDDQVDNVVVWANWVNVKKDYRSGRNLGNFRVMLFARDPFTPECDQTKEPPAP